MNKYISKTLFLLLCITFLGNNVRAEGPVSGANQSSGKIALFCMGAMAVGGLIKFACNYIHNRNAYLKAAEQLESDFVFNKKPDPFSFQSYRINNRYADKKFWLTAQEILANKEDFCEVVRGDIISKRFLTENEREQREQKEKQIREQETIFYEKNKNLKNKTIKLDTDEESSDNELKDLQIRNIKEDLQKVKAKISYELKSLYKGIEQLAGYTDVYTHIVNLINESKMDKSCSWFNKVQNISLRKKKDLDEYAVIFSGFDTKELGDFKTELQRRIKANNSWWKKIINPYYEELSMQYWNLLDRYIRVWAIDNVIQPYYIPKNNMKWQNNEK